MVYKVFQNTKLSALGMGAMRLPVIGGGDPPPPKKGGKQKGAYSPGNSGHQFYTPRGHPHLNLPPQGKNPFTPPPPHKTPRRHIRWKAK